MSKRTARKALLWIGVGIVVAAYSLYVVVSRHGPAAELVGAERVWQLQPFQVQGHAARDSFGFMVSTDLGTGMEPLVGSDFAEIYRTGIRGSSAWEDRLRLGYVPAGASFRGAPEPGRAFSLHAGRLIKEVYLDETWWEQENLLPLTQLAKPAKLRTDFDKALDRRTVPADWPDRGALEPRRLRQAQTVPFRDAVVWPFAREQVSSGSLGIGGFIAGQGSYKGPHEYVIEDRTTGVVRRVAFALVGGGERNPSMMLYFSSDGRWAFAFDRFSLKIWFIPLHVAWDYLDSTKHGAASR